MHRRFYRAGISGISDPVTVHQHCCECLRELGISLTGNTIPTVGENAEKEMHRLYGGHGFSVIIRLDRMIQLGVSPSFIKSPKIGGTRGLINNIPAVYKWLFL